MSGPSRKPTARKAQKSTTASLRGTSKNTKATRSGSKNIDADAAPQLSSQKFSLASRGESLKSGTRSTTRSSSSTATKRLSSSSRPTRATGSNRFGRTGSGVAAKGSSTQTYRMAKSQTAKANQAPASAKNRKPGNRGPQQRGTSAASAFAGLVMAHPRVMIPIILVCVLIVGYVFVDIGASLGKIHPGVSVQGVDVGGLTVDDAATKLVNSLDSQVSNARITLYENESVASKDSSAASGSQQTSASETAGSDVNGDGVIDKWTITSDTIGAYVDGKALAEQAYRIGREGNFVEDRFGAWFGGKSLQAQVAVSAERFNELISEINTEIGVAIVESSIALEDGHVSAVKGSDGRSVDQPQFIESYSDGVFGNGPQQYVIPMKTDTVHITQETAQHVADKVKSVIEDDVRIVYQKDSWTMDSIDLGDVIGQKVLQPDQALVFGNGTQSVEQKSDSVVAAYDTSYGTDSNSSYILQAYVDQEKMDAFLVRILGDRAVGAAVNASFDMSSGEVVIIESSSGEGPDRVSAELAMQNLLFGVQTDASSDRTITMVDTIIEPEFTTEQAQAMGITERLASWSIPLSGTSARIHNIERLCELIDHSAVAPGAEWSFNETTGERTAEAGFETAPVIVNGKHEDQLGGGICQVATCVYNAACFSGLGIMRRTNHEFYIAAYDDDGFADATVSWEQPDLVWVNDLASYVMITADVTDEDVVVSFWGTKDGRTVECNRGEWKAGDKYATIREVDDSLPAGTEEITQGGVDGRSIVIRYLVKDKDGNVLHDVTFNSDYSAQNEIISVGGQSSSSAAAASSSSSSTASSDVESASSEDEDEDADEEIEPVDEEPETPRETSSSEKSDSADGA